MPDLGQALNMASCNSRASAHRIWARARGVAQINGGEQTTGIFFVAPDAFGLKGGVWSELAQDASSEAMREGLATVLDRFRKEWRKLHRASHHGQGARGGTTWTEYDPDVGGVVRVEGDSKELGARYGH